jgi:hypothetical protein
MSISRRKFLRAGTLVALSAALPINVLGQSFKDRDGNPGDQQAQPDPLEHYDRAAFASYLNSIFQLYTGYSVVEVALIEVKDLQPAQTARDGKECFSLMFRGGGVALRQNTYRIDHSSLGSFQLFLVPGGADNVGAQSYVAIINRVSYADALKSAPTRTSKPADGTKPDDPVTPVAPSVAPVVAPTTATPIKTRPVQTTTPIEKPKPERKGKPSWKSGDNDNFEGRIDQ